MIGDLPLVHDGMVSCPKKQTGMARDACVKEQARCGLGCGFGCVRGRAAIEEREAFLADARREEEVRESVRAKHREYYAKFGRLPSQAYRPTGRPVGRPRKAREPVLGGRLARR